jgi:hypothetical protein
MNGIFRLRISASTPRFVSLSRFASSCFVR